MQFSFYAVLVLQTSNHSFQYIRMMKYLHIIIGILISNFFCQSLQAQLSASVKNDIQLVSINTDDLYENAPVYDVKEAKNILSLMHEHIYEMNAHSYRIKLEERRIGNPYHRGEILVSVVNRPLNVRMEVLAPNKGAVVEYNAQEDKDEAFVIPRKWAPSIKFKRDIHGSLLRPGHYSIDETSLNYIDQIIKRHEEQFIKRGIYRKGVRYWGNLHVDGVPCHKIEFMDQDYRISVYTVRQGDDLIKIARDKVINPYKIKELNPEIKTYYDVKPGQVIRIPTSYGKRCVIYVDSRNYLPRRLEIYDENGWFERYSFYDIQVK